ncbi:MAG TPA: DUF1415 family protein [Polyangiaceae bacterium]|nr:DUF1415 family protein [Polyangiaceae bacterium]
MSYEQALVSEALRLNARYVNEVVEGFGLCPWAERALREGRVKTLVLLQDSPTLFEPSLSSMAELAADETVEVAMLVYPRLELGRLDFEHFARQLRQLDAERYEVSCIPLAMAAFHPDAAPDTTEAERLIPFLRRTPDPTLQLVRYSVIEHARGQFSEGTEFYQPGLHVLERLEKKPIRLREQIALNNMESVLEAGLDRFEAVVSDIRRDRDQSYRALAAGLPGML